MKTKKVQKKKKRKAKGAPDKNKKKLIVERHKVLLKLLSENIGGGMSFGEAMREAGYSKNYSEEPQLLRRTESWQKLVEKNLPDTLLTRTHTSLLKSARIDHMTFPPFNKKRNKKGEQITDEEIVELLDTVNCTVKKIVHGEQARHIYFWSPDNLARDRALDKAYKLKGKYEPEEHNIKWRGLSKEDIAEQIARRIAGDS